MRQIDFDEIKGHLNGDEDFVPFESLLPSYQRACVELLLEEVAKYQIALDSANSICRSMHSIVERQGKKTNWEAFGARLKEQLDIQHAIIYE